MKITPNNVTAEYLKKYGESDMAPLWRNKIVRECDTAQLSL